MPRETSTRQTKKQIHPSRRWLFPRNGKDEESTDALVKLDWHRDKRHMSYFRLDFFSFYEEEEEEKEKEEKKLFSSRSQDWCEFSPRRLEFRLK